jgi:hypothetical protein
MNIYSGGRLLNTYERIKYRPIKDDEMKRLFEKISLNTEFALPDRLVQDFINDGSIRPKFKNCHIFTDSDFDDIIIHFKKRKNIKKLPSKPGSKKKKMKKNGTKKSKDKINKIKKIKKIRDKINKINK